MTPLFDGSLAQSSGNGAMDRAKSCQSSEQTVTTPYHVSGGGDGSGIGFRENLVEVVGAVFTHKVDKNNPPTYDGKVQEKVEVKPVISYLPITFQTSDKNDAYANSSGH
ncbi:hypothetical protein CBL_07453 [Carabus blaptoides fortunei]